MTGAFQMGRLILLLVCLAALIGEAVSRIEGAEPAVSRPAFSRGVVAADHPLASEAGAEMLRQGGNVVDAAVATSFALSVVRPESCGLGGGGFMVIWNAATRSTVALDYRERAPQRATANMFIPTADGDGVSATHSRTGGLAAGIPGNVAGLCYALDHYGTLDLPTVLAPAIRLAQQGVTVDATTIRNQRETLNDLRQLGPLAGRFETLNSLYLNQGRTWNAGDQFHSPLETVLRQIASDGASGFYRGEVGAALLAEVQRQGGIWTAADLQPDRLVVEREPLRLPYHGAEILTMPPPSSGGVALIEMLQILAAYDHRFPDQPLTKLEHNSAAYLHRLTEASKHAFADRAAWLGDADFVAVPVARLTNPRYTEELAKTFNPHITLAPSDYGRIALPDDAGTSHLSVVDAAGNAVACTETINTTFGSFVVEPKFGVILNNEMDDFTARPGEPNAFGLIQSERNAVAAGKKPLS
ncbi:MAG: gamma-glutamyltransferase family protein, partial [Planctomycetaceae bacterium]